MHYITASLLNLLHYVMAAFGVAVLIAFFTGLLYYGLALPCDLLYTYLRALLRPRHTDAQADAYRERLEVALARIAELEAELSDARDAQAPLKLNIDMKPIIEAEIDPLKAWVPAKPKSE